MTAPLFTQLPPLSLYIHIPWCVRKCPYCDFNSHTSDTALPEQEYTRALIEDLTQELSQVQDRPLHSIFFGGGTPSLFSAQSIDTLLCEVQKRIPFADDIEITLEANPGTVEQAKFSGYHNAGVNRLSIGVQSFNPKHLQTLGRIHNREEAIQAVATARHAGFDNFNLDLMHGLPDQTCADGLADLQQAIDLGPTHISWYQLTIEPNTAFYSSPPILPKEDQLADIQQAGEQLLAQHGFKQYEISAYSQAGLMSRHNLNYWGFGDYIGIGAGAHGKITQLETQAIQRYWKTRAPADYLNSHRVAGKEYRAGHRALSADELPVEFMMNALRQTEGFITADFNARTGLDISAVTPTLAKLTERGLLEQTPDRIKLTELGSRFLNEVLTEF